MFSQKKPYSAVTVTIENLTSETYQEEDLAGIPELVEAITLQASGPTEAARAIRKKLKYGNVHRQIRALVLLDGLIQNAGPRFQRAFADEPLLERLRVCGSSDLSDPEVKKKCRELFRSWAQYGNISGLERIARLHQELPKRKVVMTQERSKVIKETENPFGDDEEEEAVRAAQEREEQQKRQQQAGPSKPLPQFGRSPGMAESFSRMDANREPFNGLRSKKKDKSKGKHRKGFNLEAEKDQMKSVIAESSIASTNLINALQSINRERERISDNRAAVERFEMCKQLRRRVLRYIHHVEHEQWLGGLLHANDELVHALMTYEQMDQSIDADSDSDDELAEQAHLYRMVTSRKDEQSKGNSDTPPPQPPRPAPPQLESDSEEENSEDDADENDPFADRNMVHTPAVEQGEPRW